MILVERFPRLRSRWIAYASAVASVALAAFSFWCVNGALSAPYLIPFTLAVVFSALFGAGPGVLAWLLAIVVTDYFFVVPIGTLGLSRVVWIAAAVYAAALLCTLFAAQLLRHKLARSALPRNLVQTGNTGAYSTQELIGRLDGEAEGELYGWALDKQQPLIAPKITFYVDERPAGEALAVYYRPDVMEHSFFFDLSECCAPQSSVRVEARFWDGRPLPNSPLIVKMPSKDEPRHRETVLFMHIAKTAGTAFRETMSENYKHSQIAYLYPHPPGLLVSALGLLPLEQRARFRLVMGHFQYGIHEFLPQESTYVTIVRRPVERVVSHYYYLLEMQPELALNAGSTMSLVEMLEARRTTDLDNLMVRCFSGVNEFEVPVGHVDRRVYELAVDHLRTRFKFVGYQDRVDEAYAELQKLFDWQAKKSLEIVNRGARSGAEIDEATRKAIEHWNQWDCKLYSEIRELFP